VTLTAKIEKVSDPGNDPPLKMGKEIVLMPDESAFDSAAKWRIQLPTVSSDEVSNFLLRITYQGDIARVYAGGKLLTDDFYHGEPWIIGLDRIPTAVLATPLELRILPMHAQAPIYLPSSVLPIIQMGQPPELKEVELVPVYRATMRTEP